MKALVTLVPDESKRLIGRAVARLPVVRRALDEGVLIVGAGSTNSQVIEACTGTATDPSRFVAGIVTRGTLCVTPREQRLANKVFRRGQEKDVAPLDALAWPESPKVLVKGANAVDVDGRAGVLVAAEDGGTAGRLLPRFLANGWDVVVPVGLEKLVPSVPDAVERLGMARLDKSLGARVGMIPLMGATVVTEREALGILSGVVVHLVASGGIGGSQGAVTLLLEGSDEEVGSALTEIESVKGFELPSPLLQDCRSCHHRCDYAGLDQESLPAHLRGGFSA